MKEKIIAVGEGKNHSGWKIIAEWSLPGFTEFKSTVFPSIYCFTRSHMEFTEHVLILLGGLHSSGWLEWFFSTKISVWNLFFSVNLSRFHELKCQGRNFGFLLFIDFNCISLICLCIDVIYLQTVIGMVHNSSNVTYSSFWNVYWLRYLDSVPSHI